MSRVKSMDLLSQVQKESTLDMCAVDQKGLNTDLSLVDCVPLSSQLHSQANHSATLYQDEFLPNHFLCPSEANGVDMTGARKRSKSHEPISINDQAPMLPACKILHDSQQNCTGHCRSSSLQDFTLTKNCDSLAQQSCEENSYTSPLVNCKKQSNSFQMSDLLMSKAESVPEQLHQEHPPLTDDSSRCRFGKFGDSVTYTDEG